MTALWFGIVAGMLAMFIVMDGFDFGAGIVHYLVARTEDERRQVFAAIGPLWDGNEVWLLASGGALFVAFPSVLAAGLSGFYLAIFLVLWALILRGLSVELRGHIDNALWRSFWDFAFCVSSTALALLFGAALGNILRGVPLDEHGWFELTLFTDWSARGEVGILDWYTVLVGAFAVVALAAHGAAFLAWKTAGEIEARADRLAKRLFLAVAVAWPIVTLATWYLRAFAFSAVTIAGAVVIASALYVAIRGRDLKRFLASAVFLLATLATTAIARYPVFLASVDGTRTLDAHAASTGAENLGIALTWWLLGIPLVIAYFTMNFRLHRNKVL